LDMVKLMVAAATVALFGVNMLLVAAVFALSVWIPGWTAALAVAVILIVIGAALALVGWKRRVSAPMAVTRQTVKEDVQWARERLGGGRTWGGAAGSGSAGRRPPRPAAASR